MVKRIKKNKTKKRKPNAKTKFTTQTHSLWSKRMQKSRGGLSR